jgi:hypothetical protein
MVPDVGSPTDCNDSCVALYIRRAEGDKLFGLIFIVNKTTHFSGLSTVTAKIRGSKLVAALRGSRLVT